MNKRSYTHACHGMMYSACMHQCVCGGGRVWVWVVGWVGGGGCVHMCVWVGGCGGVHMWVGVGVGGCAHLWVSMQAHLVPPVHRVGAQGTFSGTLSMRMQCS